MNIERENILIMMVMAVMGAIGCHALICAMTGVEVAELGMLTNAGLLAGFTGLIFAGLLVYHFSGSHK